MSVEYAGLGFNLYLEMPAGYQLNRMQHIGFTLYRRYRCRCLHTGSKMTNTGNISPEDVFTHPLHAMNMTWNGTKPPLQTLTKWTMLGCMATNSTSFAFFGLQVVYFYIICPVWQVFPLFSTLILSLGTLALCCLAGIITLILLAGCLNHPCSSSSLPFCWRFASVNVNLSPSEHRMSLPFEALLAASRCFENRQIADFHTSFCGWEMPLIGV